MTGSPEPTPLSAEDVAVIEASAMKLGRMFLPNAQRLLESHEDLRRRLADMTLDRDEAALVWETERIILDRRLADTEKERDDLREANRQLCDQARETREALAVPAPRKEGSDV